MFSSKINISVNYFKIYENLLDNARSRGLDKTKLDFYTEKHRKIPGCLGGTYDKDNIYLLTPEEHFVAHQLLVKMYPDKKSLAWAAIRMTHHSTSNRVNNKLYGWLRKRHSEYSKKRTGEKNSSFGKYWYHNPDTMEVIKVAPENKPDGWLPGRSSNKCHICGKVTRLTRHKYCEQHWMHWMEVKKKTIHEKHKKMAEDLWEQFLQSKHESITKFAAAIKTSQPRLTQLWNKFIEEYRNTKKHGKSFKSTIDKTK